MQPKIVDFRVLEDRSYVVTASIKGASVDAELRIRLPERRKRHPYTHTRRSDYKHHHKPIEMLQKEALTEIVAFCRRVIDAITVRPKPPVVATPAKAPILGLVSPKVASQ